MKKLRFFIFVLICFVVALFLPIFSAQYKSCGPKLPWPCRTDIVPVVTSGMNELLKPEFGPISPSWASLIIFAEILIWTVLLLLFAQFITRTKNRVKSVTKKDDTK